MLTTLLFPATCLIVWLLLHVGGAIEYSIDELYREQAYGVLLVIMAAVFALFVWMLTAT